MYIFHGIHSSSGLQQYILKIVVRDCAQARVNDYLLLASLPCSGHGGAVSEKWGQSRVIGGLEIGGLLPSNSAHGAHGALQ